MSFASFKEHAKAALEFCHNGLQRLSVDMHLLRSKTLSYQASTIYKIGSSKYVIAVCHCSSCGGKNYHYCRDDLCVCAGHGLFKLALFASQHL